MRGLNFAYICPQCKSSLTEEPDAYRCPSCRHRYPILLGIPDFRVFPDPYISIEDDRRKAQRLAEHYDELSFPELVSRYWEMTPTTPRALAGEYIRGVLRLPQRSVRTWTMIQSTVPPNGRALLLDVGCGTAGFLAAAGRAFDQAVGIDIAFRWLLIAKKRLEELRLSNVRLVCGCAEYLPFSEGVADLVVAEDVLDHARDPEALIHEGARTLKAGGVMYLSTPNRYSLAPDPHVSVWGVGFLPEGLRDRFVQWRKGIPYGPIRPVSYMRLRWLLRGVPGGHYHIMLPGPAELERPGLSWWQRVQLRLYGIVRGSPVLRDVLRFVGPVFQVLYRRPG